MTFSFIFKVNALFGSKKFALSSSCKAPWSLSNIIFTFPRVPQVNTLFGCKKSAYQNFRRLLENSWTSFWHFHIFSKWMCCLVQEHPLCYRLASFSIILQNHFDISMCSQNACNVWFEDIGLINVSARLFDNHSTSFWHLHVFSKWTCIVWFKNINLVKVLQSFLIICWHSFDIFTCS